MKQRKNTQNLWIDQQWNVSSANFGGPFEEEYFYNGSPRRPRSPININ
jgi:hypothetical protein